MQCGGELGPEFMEPGPLRDMLEALRKMQDDVSNLVCSNEALTEEQGKAHTTMLVSYLQNSAVSIGCFELLYVLIVSNCCIY